LGKNYSHIVLVLLLLFAQACSKKKSAMPDLRESYSYLDTRPFGTSVAYAIVRHAYPSNTVMLSKKEIADNYNWTSDTASVYFNISRNFFANDRDAEALLEFVYKGNTAFIASSNIDSALLNRLFCKLAMPNNYFMQTYDTTSTKYVDAINQYEENYSYFYYPFVNYFTEVNGSYARIAGYNGGGNINMFVFMWGKGRFYFHCEPRAFSNYFLLTKNNYLYMQQLIQMLPAVPQNLYWDTYYGRKNYASNAKSSGSTWSVLFKYPPLKYAFLICLALLLFFIFFNSKRKQRIVPVIKPTENTSIAFAEAIAGLYLSKKDNKVVAEKMITYFNEHVRTKYFLNMHINDSSYADILSRKSNVAMDTTKQLTDAIVDINASEKVSDEKLLLLNGLIEKFFKRVS
jgi:hypothetical protein